jgi:hypothetical protein
MDGGREVIDAHTASEQMNMFEAKRRPVLAFGVGIFAWPEHKIETEKEHVRYCSCFV